MTAERFQILALDGGGVRGLYSAAVLAAVERDFGVRVTDHFDLIAGTSTGGLIALALGAGRMPLEVVEFYRQHASRVFNLPRLRKPWQLLHSKYGSGRLAEAIRGEFGDRLLGSSEKRLVIPSYDIDSGRVHIFKTPHHHELTRDLRVPMWEVAMATSAAPTYLPPWRLSEDQSRLIDGGVWANNPTALGIAEAVSMLAVPLEAIRVLSLGTTVSPARHPQRPNVGGIVQWLRGNNLTEAILRGQSQGAFGLAQHLVRKENVLRIDSTVPDGFFKLDAGDASGLIAQASSESRHRSPEVRRLFLSHVAGSYSPAVP